jgi:hypothetical protein
MVYTAALTETHEYTAMADCTTKLEKWNVEIAENVAMLRDAPPDVVTSLRKALKTGHAGQIYVHYSCAKSTPDRGRLYAKGPSLQSMPGWVRRLVADNRYHDIDVVNAAPTILVGHCDRLGMAAPTLRSYVADRESVLKTLMERHDIDRGTAKKLVLLVINFGSYHREFAARQQTANKSEMAASLHADSSDLDALRAETLALYDVLRDENKELHAVCAKGGGNIRGRFMAHLYFSHEARVLECMNAFFTAQGYTVGVLVFDGLMIERKGDGALESLLRACESDVKRITGLDVKLAEKSMKPTAEDVERLAGAVCLEDMAPMQRFIRLLATAASDDGLRRMDDHVYKPHPTIRGVFVADRFSSDFINDVLRCDPVYHSGVFAKKLDEWFLTQDHELFPMIRERDVDDAALSFRDGWFNVVTCMWYPMDDDKRRELCGSAPDPPMTFHFFDMNCGDVIHQPTPMWQKLVKTQLYGREWETGPETEEEMELFNVFQAMIGRLFMPAGTDNWQMWPFLKGEANTGKGTVVDIIKSMFPKSAVASFDGGRQSTFNLEDVVQKRLLIFPDLPKHLDKVLAQDVFLSMVSAESLSVSRKHRTPLNVDWSVPGLMAGNVVPSYDDEGGRVVRRLAVFSFDTLVTKRDTSLKKKIVSDELASVALGCIMACHNLRERVGDDDLHKHLPKSVLASEDDIRAEVSPLYNFVKNGDDFWDVVYDPKATTTLLELRNAYQNHIRFHRQDRAKWTNDHHPIKMAGFSVSKVNVCKDCDKVAKKETCGDHYDPRNRKRVHVVEGMRLKKKVRAETA